MSRSLKLLSIAFALIIAGSASAQDQEVWEIQPLKKLTQEAIVSPASDNKTLPLPPVIPRFFPQHLYNAEIEVIASLRGMRDNRPIYHFSILDGETGSLLRGVLENVVLDTTDLSGKNVYYLEISDGKGTMIYYQEPCYKTINNLKEGIYMVPIDYNGGYGFPLIILKAEDYPDMDDFSDEGLLSEVSDDVDDLSDGIDEQLSSEENLRNWEESMALNYVNRNLLEDSMDESGDFYG